MPDSTAITTVGTPPEAIERALVKGDLAGLSTEERMAYVARLCAALGLNPLTVPFRFLTLGGKLVIYPTKDCTEQLRKIHTVTLEIASQSFHEELFVVHARASMPTVSGGTRRDEDLGAVNLAGLKGEARANAIMKAITKAKRRATLSICGLGFLDEMEALDVARTEQQTEPPPQQQLPAPFPSTAPPNGQTPVSDLMDRIDALVVELALPRDEFDARLQAAFGHSDPSKLTTPELEKVLRGLESRKAKQQQTSAA